ncbi:MAG: type II toxin-antitoxin system prevent-host-death family antitoxin [Candidatus Methanosuratincola sp.]
MANTVELKNKTNEILREVMKGQPVIITYRGKPAASLTPLTEDELEDFILENSPRIKKMVAEAEKDIQRGRIVSLDKYLASLNE